VLAGAKGLAIMTVIKAGFLGTARYGNGIVVARLDDGTWSAPSAIGTVGGGFGGQIGFELTDFVFILNDKAAVRTFSQAGSLTLGGNVSIAAGPVGRNAEAAGAASLKGVAAIFAYSKTKGLFAGVSLEGSAIIERRDANEKLYGHRYKAAELLTGAVRPPPAAASLMDILNSRVFAGVSNHDDAMYNDIPVYDDRHDDVVWEGRRGNGFGEGVQRDRTGSVHTARGNDSDYVDATRPQRASTWTDDVYDRTPVSPSGISGRNRGSSQVDDNYVYSDNPRNSTGSVKPGRPSAPKPMFAAKTGSLKSNEAVALFTFEADQPGDLGFKKGDVITVTKKTSSDNDWW
jgi:lipid-binding SYLF domain-containing protein